MTRSFQDDCQNIEASGKAPRSACKTLRRLQTGACIADSADKNVAFQKERNAARLCGANVGDAEHELEGAVAARDGGAVRDEDRSSTVLGVRDAREDDPEGDCVEQLAPDHLHRHQPRAYPAVPRPPRPVPCYFYGELGNGRNLGMKHFLIVSRQ